MGRTAAAGRWERLASQAFFTDLDRIKAPTPSAVFASMSWTAFCAVSTRRIFLTFGSQ